MTGYSLPVHSHCQEEIPEECEDSCEYPDAYMEAMDRSNEIVPNSFRAEKDDDTVSVVSNRSIRLNKDVETTSSRQSLKVMSRRQSPHNSSPTDSPTTCSRTSSPKVAKNSGKTQTSMLRLLSTRAMDSSISTSLPVSPLAGNDNSSISSADSDGEMTVCFKHYFTSN